MMYDFVLDSDKKKIKSFENEAEVRAFATQSGYILQDESTRVCCDETKLLDIQNGESLRE